MTHTALKSPATTEATMGSDARPPAPLDSQEIREEGAGVKTGEGPRCGPLALDFPPKPSGWPDALDFEGRMAVLREHADIMAGLDRHFPRDHAARSLFVVLDLAAMGCPREGIVAVARHSLRQMIAGLDARALLDTATEGSA